MLNAKSAFVLALLVPFFGAAMPARRKGGLVELGEEEGGGEKGSDAGGGKQWEVGGGAMIRGRRARRHAPSD